MTQKVSTLLSLTVIINMGCYNGSYDSSNLECSSMKHSSYAKSDDEQKSQNRVSNLIESTDYSSKSHNCSIINEICYKQGEEPYCIEDFIPNEKQDSGREGYYNERLNLNGIVEEYMTESFSEIVQKKILIEKSRRVLSVYGNDVLLKEYGIALGENPKGDKEREGDKKTPEGEFYITEKKIGNFGKALLLGYPHYNSAERGFASELINRREYGAITKALDQCKTPLQNTLLGGAIEIHGGGGTSSGDWTLGCIGLGDNDNSEVFAFADKGCTKKGGYRTKVVVMP